MIFRAVFWIGLVALLMPREPDLGFGRPDAIDPGVGDAVANWAASRVGPGMSDPKMLCHYNAQACSAGGNFVEGVREAALNSLAEVKAELRDSQRKR